MNYPGPMNYAGGAPIAMDQALASGDPFVWLAGVVTGDLEVEIQELATRLEPELAPTVTLALCWKAGARDGSVRARRFAQQLLQAGDSFRRLLPSPEAEAS